METAKPDQKRSYGGRGYPQDIPSFPTVASRQRVNLLSSQLHHKEDGQSCGWVPVCSYLPLQSVLICTVPHLPDTHRREFKLLRVLELGKGAKKWTASNEDLILTLLV